MQLRLATDQQPVTSDAAVPIGTGRLFAQLTSTGPVLALSLSHAAASHPLAACEIGLELPPADAWRGELNGEMAIFTEEFNAGDQRVVRETIAHLASDLIVVRTVAEKPFAGELGWSGDETPLASGNRIALAGRDPNNVPWQAEIRVHLADGDMAITDDHRLAFRNSHEVICEISLGCGDRGRAGTECGNHRIDNVDGWDELVQQHIDAWRQHFGGLVGTIPGQDPAPLIPQRLALLANGRSDPRLYFALWQAARYQLCSLLATAPATPPAAPDQWLGLLPSGLPAYLSRQLAAANADQAPNFADARQLYQAYFPDDTSTTPLPDLRRQLPDTPALAVLDAVAERSPEAVTAALKAYLTSQCSPWLSAKSGQHLSASNALAAAFPAMVVQAENHALRICPALPTDWVQGAIHGLLAPGGWTLSVEWSLSRPTKVVIAGNPAGICELRNLADEYTLIDDHEKPVPFTQHDDVITFTARPKQAYFLQRQKIRQ